MSRQPPRLLARIRQIRRAGTPAGALTPSGTDPVPGPVVDPAAKLETRIAHLEQLVEGLQDSVYREAQRQEKRLTDIEKRMDPATIAAALSQDARERGL
jgi:hypothetical protein